MFSVDVFTVSHDYFFFSNLRNRKIFFAGEAILVSVFIITQIVLFFVPANRDVEFWIKTSLYGFGIMQVVLVLMCLVFLVGLKIGLHYQGRKWLKTRAKFRQVRRFQKFQMAIGEFFWIAFYLLTIIEFCCTCYDDIEVLI